MSAGPQASGSLAAMFVEAVDTHRGVAIEHRAAAGRWVSVDYPELRRRVFAIARGLLAEGVQPGDRLAIFASTRPEWLIVDYAALCIGAIVVPIYHTSSSVEVQHVLRHSGASVAFVEDGAPADRLERVHRQCPGLHRVISMDGDGLSELVAAGAGVADEEVRNRAKAVAPEDVSTLVYTSGTTGQPKGCMLTHANYRANTRMCARAIDLGDAARIFVFLPFAHSMTRCTGQLALEGGHTLVFFGGDLNRILTDLAESRPTHLPSVPRIFEKIHASAMGSAAPGTARRRLVDWAIDVGKRDRDLEHRHRRTPVLMLKHAMADRLVLRRVRSLFGGELRLALTGGAPIEPDILSFFHACGVLVLEGYGMTESAAASAANTPTLFRFGTVGQALAGGEITLASDGEILMRGPHIFAGYYRDTEATKAAFKGDWLCSGDLGSLDGDGFLTVTGRKKDILITSSGKNVAPAAIENALRQTRLVAQAVVIGDRRPYLVALVELDPEEVADMPQSLVSANLARDLAGVNDRFARIEQIKRFAVLPRALTQADGELTPTMKVKRAAVLDAWGDLIDGLYAGTLGTPSLDADDEPPA